MSFGLSPLCCALLAERCLKDIARLIADAQELHTAEERRRAQQQEENFLQRERERARRQLDGELEAITSRLAKWANDMQMICKGCCIF